MNADKKNQAEPIRKLLPNDFDCDDPVKTRVARLVHFAHPSSANSAAEIIRPQNGRMVPE